LYVFGFPFVLGTCKLRGSAVSTLDSRLSSLESRVSIGKPVLIAQTIKMLVSDRIGTRETDKEDPSALSS